MEKRLVKEKETTKKQEQDNKKKRRRKKEARPISQALVFFSPEMANRVPNFSVVCDFICGRKSMVRVALFLHLRSILVVIKPQSRENPHSY